jgi:hypothetical protein
MTTGIACVLLLATVGCASSPEKGSAGHQFAHGVSLFFAGMSEAPPRSRTTCRSRTLADDSVQTDCETR